MITLVKIPLSWGETYDATIVSWFKHEGDFVEQSEELCEIEYGKTTIQIESPISGTVTKILLQEGDSAEPGAVIAHIS